MIRSLVALAAGALGVTVGALGVMALGSPPPVPVDPPVTVTTLPSPTPSPVPEPTERVLLVWSPGSVPESLIQALSSLPAVDEVAVVRAGLVDLVASRDASGAPADLAPEGMTIPLEAALVEERYQAFLPPAARTLLERLGPGEVVLGSTSSRLRGLGTGAVLELAGGRRLVVAGVLDDELVGAAEVLAVHQDDVELSTPRYVLVRHDGDRPAVEAAIRREAPRGLPIRVRGPGETPYFRHGDAVLPQAAVKERFGEFAFRRTDGLPFEQDPSWVEEHITTDDVPLLGRVTCHRGLIPALRGAMAELEERSLGHLVDPDGYRGCWNPRFIAGRTGISRHAWGAAVDLNFDGNPTGLGSAQDPRLVETMERWGFTWGGFWLIPDPAHFEYLQPPER